MFLVKLAYIYCFCCVSFVYSSNVEGKVYLPNDHSILSTKVLVDDGKYQGYLR